MSEQQPTLLERAHAKLREQREEVKRQQYLDIARDKKNLRPIVAEIKALLPEAKVGNICGPVGAPYCMAELPVVTDFRLLLRIGLCRVRIHHKFGTSMMPLRAIRQHPDEFIMKVAKAQLGE